MSWIQAGHRYPAAWTGDIVGDWKTLAAHVTLFPTTAATMLWVYYSADLGGFRGQTLAENYVRWLQCTPLPPLSLFPPPIPPSASPRLVGSMFYSTF